MRSHISGKGGLSCSLYIVEYCFQLLPGLKQFALKPAFVNCHYPICISLFAKKLINPGFQVLPLVKMVVFKPIIMNMVSEGRKEVEIVMWSPTPFSVYFFFPMNLVFT